MNRWMRTSPRTRSDTATACEYGLGMVGGYAAQIIKLNKRGKQSAVTIHTVGKKRPNSEDQNLVPFNCPKLPHICKVPYIFAARHSDRIARPIWAPAARMRPTWACLYILSRTWTCINITASGPLKKVLWGKKSSTYISVYVCPLLRRLLGIKHQLSRKSNVPPKYYVQQRMKFLWLSLRGGPRENRNQTSREIQVDSAQIMTRI